MSPGIPHVLKDNSTHILNPGGLPKSRAAMADLLTLKTISAPHIHGVICLVVALLPCWSCSARFPHLGLGVGLNTERSLAVGSRKKAQGS